MNFMKSLILDLDIVTGETVTRQNFDMGIFFMLTNKICINESFSPSPVVLLIKSSKWQCNLAPRLKQWHSTRNKTPG